MKGEMSADVTRREQNNTISLDQAETERNKLEKYESSFVSHVQDAYLKNMINLETAEKIDFKLQVHTNLSDTIDKLLDAVINHDPKTFTKEEFESLKKRILSV